MVRTCFYLVFRFHLPKSNILLIFADKVHAFCVPSFFLSSLHDKRIAILEALDEMPSGDLMLLRRAPRAKASVEIRDALDLTMKSQWNLGTCHVAKPPFDHSLSDELFIYILYIYMYISVSYAIDESWMVLGGLRMMLGPLSLDCFVQPFVCFCHVPFMPAFEASPGRASRSWSRLC